MPKDAGETKVVRGEKEVADVSMAFLERAAKSSYMGVVTHGGLPKDPKPQLEATRLVLQQNPKLLVEVITDITKENMGYYEQISGLGVHLRHIDGNKVSFAISKEEYISTPATALEEAISKRAEALQEIIWSTREDVVQQAGQIFQMMWSGAVPGEARIAELKEGAVPPRMEIVRDPSRVQQLFVELVDRAREEVLVMMPTSNSFHREERIGVVDALQAAASERGVSVSVIAPDSAVGETLEAMGRTIEKQVGRKMLEYRRIVEAKTPNTVTVLVTDRSASLIIEQKDDAQGDFGKAIGVATYSTSSSTVTANARFFERVWEEVDVRRREEALLEKERASRRRAELLQDILSHDIRNYLQVSKSSAEMLREDLAGNLRKLNDAGVLIDSIIRAANGSSELIERTKRLAKVMADSQGVELRPMDLEESFQRVIPIITKAYPGKETEVSSKVAAGARVLADDLLDEVFLNVLSNAVKHTPGGKVLVEISAREEDSPSGSRLWRIEVSDHGRGVPGDLKERLFKRYMTTASGTGLGLSIVHALVTERYSGRVQIVDRVDGRPEEGAKVEIWLPGAP